MFRKRALSKVNRMMQAPESSGLQANASVLQSSPLTTRFW
ncbi:hypothetical protein UYSO10_0437 [Kosakonia radicincitans]|nr:hypothetical protein UYSO10_0437 [Kosakonia radicincitans]